ncbi:hypothetical protein MTR_5g055520 [Medicago truncatula]|uniref:Uncharacterized protein n=1 Tax=Medicago truncatula TaxID=3880 RepID=G7K0F1_MEDTR|nr:hypothetical protein MTR_5g055520 [Medicago truncatula]
MPTVFRHLLRSVERSSRSAHLLDFTSTVELLQLTKEHNPIQRNLLEVHSHHHIKECIPRGCFECNLTALPTDKFQLTEEHDQTQRHLLEVWTLDTLMGTKRLSFPTRVFDVFPLCRKIILEVNRVLRPSVFFWCLFISRDKLNGVGIVVYKKPTSKECYEKLSKNECIKIVELKYLRFPLYQ